MKKSYAVILFMFSFFVFFCGSLNSLFINCFAFAIDGNIVEYDIYDDKGEVLLTKSFVEEGDTFINSNFCEYEIYKVEGNRGYARKLRDIKPPKISRKELPKSWGLNRKKIGLYMTHNDESYTLSDGYDSVYGEGGIHDVCKALGSEFACRGINVVLDETLHIPHDSSAYARSGVTARRLMEDEYPDALFDIHRDGVARKYYYTSFAGKDYSKIRIVVGKSNPDYEENYAFAQKVFAIGASMYPWLFLDIYSGKGHYNQALQDTNLLFEMGTYLIEKEFVYNSIPFLADVVETALYDSIEGDDEEIIVDEKVPETGEIEVDEENSYADVSGKTRGWIGALVVSALLGAGLVFWAVWLYKQSCNKNKKPLN